MVDESGVVTGIHAIDTDFVVKRVCVFPPCIIAEESSRGRQETTSVEIE